MKEVFEKIKERLEEEKGIAFLTLANTGDKTKDIVYDEVMVYLNTAIEIVNQVAEEYKEPTLTVEQLLKPNPKLDEFLKGTDEEVTGKNVGNKCPGSNSEIPNMSKKPTISNEFCEWVQEGEDEYVNCKYSYQEINSGDVDYFKFCPYCGRKIKVVQQEITKDCNTCANNTEPDEIDNGCYMCCKGIEDNYQPKGEK